MEASTPEEETARSNSPIQFFYIRDQMTFTVLERMELREMG
jgi:hypothetical protein